jgi:hypothetical protein
MNRATMLKKLKTANSAIAQLSMAFPSDDTRCMYLVTMERLIWILEEEIGEAS